jgi:hypothetical protein
VSTAAVPAADAAVRLRMLMLPMLNGRGNQSLEVTQESLSSPQLQTLGRAATRVGRDEVN